MQVSVSVIVDCQPKKCILLTSFFNTPLSIVSFIFHRILSWEAFFSNDWLVWRPENWKLPMGEGRGTYGNNACNKLWSYNCFKVNYRWVAPSSQWSSWMYIFSFWLRVILHLFGTYQFRHKKIHDVWRSLSVILGLTSFCIEKCQIRNCFA